MTRPRSTPSELATIRARMVANIEDAPTRALRKHATQVLAEWDKGTARREARANLTQQESPTQRESPFARFERALTTTMP
jgi:hypothetical protein